MAKNVAFDKVTVYATETSASMPLVLGHRVDYSNFGYTSAQLKQFEKIGMRMLRSPTNFGQAVLINYGKHPEFNDKRVRQALAHGIDGGQCAQVAVGPAGEAIKLQTGLSNSQVPLWLSKGAIAKLITYDYSQDKATQLLESAGWTQKAGAWILPSGKPASHEMLFPSDQADTSAAATKHRRPAQRPRDQNDSAWRRFGATGRRAEEGTVRPRNIACLGLGGSLSI